MIKWLRKNIVFVVTHKFDDIFRGVPRGKPCSMWFEIGEFDEQTSEYLFEGMAPLYLAPDGSVWARICDGMVDLPDIGGTDG